MLCALPSGFRSEAQVPPFLCRVPSGSADPPGSQEAPGKRYVGAWEGGGGWSHRLSGPSLFLPQMPPQPHWLPWSLPPPGGSRSVGAPGQVPMVHLGRKQGTPPRGRVRQVVSRCLVEDLRPLSFWA